MSSLIIVGSAVMVICYRYGTHLKPRDLSAASPASRARRKEAPMFNDSTRSVIPPQRTREVTAERRDSLPPVLRLLYNRVPKCGSTTLLTLLRRLSARNGFRHLHCKTYDKRMLTSEEQEELVEEVMSTEVPSSYDRHVYFLNFEKFGCSNPTYVNMIREPVERIASSFYYSRAVAARRRNATRCKALGVLQEQTFEECVQRGGDGCSFVEGRPHRSLMVPYFCGQDPRCLVVQNSWALERARQNIERHFTVVGVLEDLDIALTLLEKRVPVFFRGATAIYHKEGLHENRNLSGSSKVAPWVRDVLRRNLSLEYELYDFVRQRLHAQWRRLHT